MLKPCSSKIPQHNFYIIGCRKQMKPWFILPLASRNPWSAWWELKDRSQSSQFVRIPYPKSGVWATGSNESRTFTFNINVVEDLPTKQVLWILARLNSPFSNKMVPWCWIICFILRSNHRWYTVCMPNNGRYNLSLFEHKWTKDLCCSRLKLTFNISVYFYSTKNLFFLCWSLILPLEEYSKYHPKLEEE